MNVSVCCRYDLDCSHSGYHWRIVRKYAQFEELHRALTFYRASLLIIRNASEKSRANKSPEDGADKPLTVVEEFRDGAMAASAGVGKASGDERKTEAKTKDEDVPSKSTASDSRTTSDIKSKTLAFR